MTHYEAMQTINANAMNYLQPDKHNGYICPLCGSGSGKNGTGITTQDGGKHFTCWSCHAYTNATLTDILALKAGIEDLSVSNFRQVVEAAVQEYGQIVIDEQDNKTHIVRNKNSSLQDNVAPKVSRPINVEYVTKCCNDIEQTNYLVNRGISKSTIKKFKIGYDKKFAAGNGKTWKAILFFTGISSYEARNCDAKASSGERHRKRGEGQIFNADALKNNEPIFITESIIDALSIIEAGGNAISAGGTSGVDMIVRAAKDSTVPCFILTMDNDEAGQKAIRKLVNNFNEQGIKYETPSLSELYNGYKDANEVLISDRAKFVKSIAKVKLKANSDKENVLDYLTIGFFDDDVAIFQKYANCITGFENIDAENKLYPGLYVLGAVSSIGKTTFMHQMCDQMAKNSEQVIFISYEQSRLELVSKGISRLIMQNYRHNISSIDIRSGFTDDTVNSAKNDYLEFAGNITIIEADFDWDIDRIIDKIITFIGKNHARPIIIIDYLQVIAPVKDANDKQLSIKDNMDYCMKKLKSFQRDNNLVIFVISSVNRSKYNEPISFESLKESGGIEFTADVIWGLQLQIMSNKSKAEDKEIKQAKAENPRKIEIVKLKNRYGKTNTHFLFDYYASSDLIIAKGKR